METAKLKRFAQYARRTLLEQVAAKLTLVLAQDSAARRESAPAIKALEEQIQLQGQAQFIDTVAYTWFNRFCALRFMDVNRYNRVNIVSPADPGQFQPEILAEAKMGHIDEELVPDKTRQQIFALLNGTAPSREPQAEAYRLLLVAACNSWHRPMPFLFEKIADYTELLMPDDLLSGNSILAYTREAMTPDACKDVEVIGWLYQFYISERKDQVMARKSAVPTEDIPAVTQLFTPHWIVRYLVENSLGRLWLLNRPGSQLRQHMPYYIEESGAGVPPACSDSEMAGKMPAPPSNEFQPYYIEQSGAGVPPACSDSEMVGKMPAPPSNEFQPFHPWEEIETTHRHLPHWQQEGTTYFITFRLNDSIPQEKLVQWEAERSQWLTSHPEPWDETTTAEYSKLFPQRRQQWLDSGYGRGLLKLPAIAEVVRSALRYFDEKRYLLDEFVLMPNHVHVLVKPLPGYDLSSILHSWKSFTAKAINQVIGGTGAVWQDESYDHIVRSEDQLNFYRRYIRENPAKARSLSIQSESGVGILPAIDPQEAAGKMPAPLFLKITKPEEIHLCDPACGSGHMLTYAFDLLTLIYEEEGYAPSEIPALILRHNLHGLEICPRAAQLAELALVFKAREKSRRFFQPEHFVRPHIIELRDVRFAENELHEYIKELGLGDLFNEPMLKLLHQFEEAKNFGSLIQPCLEERAIAVARSSIEAKDLSSQLFLRETHLKVLRVLEQAEALTQRYHVVVANPPYMGTQSQSSALKNFLKSGFNEFKSDLFAAFAVRILELTLDGGKIGLMTPFTWMFIQTYEPLRRKLLIDNSIRSLIRPEYHAFFDSAFVPICALTVFKGICDEPATYIDLTQFMGSENQAPNALEAIQNPGCTWRYTATAIDLRRLPGIPIAYWVTEKVIQIFDSTKPLGNLVEARQGLATADNGRFLRFWAEVGFHRIGFGKANRTEAMASGCRWFPYNKGGQFRKWYGNHEYVVDWEDDGRNLKDFTKSVIRNPNTYFKKSVSWSDVTASLNAFRAYPEGFIYDSTGHSAFPNNQCTQSQILCLCNNVFTQKIVKVLNPTMHFHVGYFNVLPAAIIPESVADSIAISLIALARADWDNFETSWDFHTLPLLRPDLKGATLEATWQNWEAHCTAAIHRMQELETENNRLFIAAYGLEGELQPEVPEEQITLARADAKKDMVAFLSYAVGCMMGRYSLDSPGLILANAGDTLSEFLAKVGRPLDQLTFAPDEDGVIPILDGEWFPDDITERFKKFLKVTFGETHFEENIKFIEASLGKNIRKYFLTDFYKNHIQTYKKRPIYWLFSSPKGSFNALIYLHRYRPDTVSVVLNDYLREFLTKLLAHKSHLEAVSIRGSASAGEKSKAIKEIESLKKMIDELNDYERMVLYPLATKQIEIDLDDGVKVNYQKFGSALKKIPGLDAGEE
jgi:REP element-mobilizing transposase RayT